MENVFISECFVESDVSGAWNRHFLRQFLGSQRDMRWYSTSLLLEDEGVTINGPLVLQFYAIFKRSRAAKIDIAWVAHLLFNCRKKVAYCLELRRHQLVILYGCTPLQRLPMLHTPLCELVHIDTRRYEMRTR